MNAPNVQPGPEMPGLKIKAFRKQAGITLGNLATGLELSYSDLGLLLVGRLGITARLAIQLERCLGEPAQFWLDLDHAYQSFTVRRHKREPI